jgi:hypothetical protein
MKYCLNIYSKETDAFPHEIFPQFLMMGFVAIYSGGVL